MVPGDIGYSTVYPLRAKVHFLMGHYQQALDDLETSMRQDLDGARHIFGCGGTKPNDPHDLWRMEEVNSFADRLPGDYRSWLVRGLYWTFFTTFSTERDQAYPEAFKDFQKASTLNPRAALPHFFLGHLYTHMSFWT